MARILLAAPLDLYVDFDNGNDANDGLTPWNGGSGSPKKTLNATWDEGALRYDLQGFDARINLAVGQVHAPLSANVGWIGQRGYFSVSVQGDNPNDSSTIVDGGGGNAFQFGANSGGGVQCIVRNLKARASGSGISVFGGGNGVIASNVTFGNCPGSAIVCAHGAEAAFQDYILFSGTIYGCLAQAVTGGRFTGGESATWAIGTNISTTLATLYCSDAQMNLGGLVSVNPRLVSGIQAACTANGTILTGGVQNNIPGNLDTHGSPYVNLGGVVT